MKTNKEQVVKIALQGEIRQPSFAGYKISSEGIPEILPGTGGITFNFAVGDSCMNISGDHVEPGVSIYSPKENDSSALMALACIGNEAKIITGPAAGKKGWVTGKHGGINNVILDFPKDVLEELAIGDRIQIKAYGQGLKFLDYSNISVMNIEPELLEKLNIREKDGKIFVPVVKKIPAYLMGSGIGSSTTCQTDYDIMTADVEKNKEFGIDKLKFGDIVLLEDCDNTFGIGYLKGAVSVGVIVHSNCIKSGHGPGVVVILSSKESVIDGIITEGANIKNYQENKNYYTIHEI